MSSRRLKFSLAALTALCMIAGPALIGGVYVESGVAEAKSASEPALKKNSAKKGKKARRGKRRRRKPTGRVVKSSQLRATPLERPSGELWIISENLKEEVRVQLYGRDGEFDDEALAKLDHEFRCRRTREERSVDPRLYEMLSRIQDHFGGKRIHLVSGFRFQRNEGSRHYHASAMDIRIPGVSIKKLRAYASTLDAGGMGIGLYPRSNFVHVDFRAPGQPSYRWVDYSRPGVGGKRGKRRSRRAKRRRAPNT